MNSVLSTPIVYLKGVGPKRGEILQKEAGIHTYEDLINYFPFRYIDKSSYNKITEIPDTDFPVQLKGKIIGYKEVKFGRAKRLEVKFEDNTGDIDLVWFKGGKWILPKLKIGGWAKVYGKAKKYGSRYNIAHPEIEFLENENEDSLGIQAVYHSGEKLQNLGFSSKGIERIVLQLLPQIKGQIDEVLPQWIIGELNLFVADRIVDQKTDHQEKDQRNQARKGRKYLQ